MVCHTRISKCTGLTFNVILTWINDRLNVEGDVWEMAGKTRFWDKDHNRRMALAVAWVVPEPSRCVQCGICSFNCPLGIDVRNHAWRGEPVKNSVCINCGECIARCPRDVLRFERSDLFAREAVMVQETSDEPSVPGQPDSTTEHTK